MIINKSVVRDGGNFITKKTVRAPSVVLGTTDSTRHAIVIISRAIRSLLH